MLRHLAVLIAAAALPCAAAFAQTAAPDPAALDLARLLLSRDDTLYGEIDTGDIEADIANRLLAPGDICDSRQTECQSAAHSAARQFAPTFRQAERARREQVFAYLIAESLRPDELARAAQYLRSDEGNRLLGMLAMLRDPDRTRTRRRELERTLELRIPDVLAAARARFRSLTRNMPTPAPR
ncbi:MAG TPA: hypothetical protein VLK25_03035 [Allosphingosinicella sp.]|nr:hypothetical protein [Allosphingosinicella sp.]